MATKKSGKHSPGLLVKEFCTQRTDKCNPCGNRYDDCVKNDTSLAISFKFPRLVKKKTGSIAPDISQNAHHILCVAEVTKVISKDESLKAVLDNTKYCVNATVNMIALPLFAHTVYWYMFVDMDGDDGPGARQKIGKYTSALKAPPFADLPNHDFDHGKYNKEVETCLNKLKAYVKEAEHDFEAGQLADALNNISNGFRNKLGKRGKRQGGTHNAWVAACENKDAEKVKVWYEPFSLAKKPAKRGFPRKVSSNVGRLKAAISFLLG